MQRGRKMRMAVAATAVIMFPLMALGQKNRESLSNPELFLTPDKVYSRIGKNLSQRYEPELLSLASKVNQSFKPDRFELLDVLQTRSGGIGFWINPNMLVPDARYLAIAARINIRLPYFPDSEWGRVGDGLDAFGKDLIKLAGESLAEIQDPSVKGAVIVMIYSKAELNDPAYWDQAEAIVLFVPRNTLDTFNAHRLSVAKMFDQSDMYVFKGPQEIQFMLNEFLHG
jgi:hypothetical protein